MFRELSAPMSVLWEVTASCSKRCFYCANYWRHPGASDSQPAQISPEQVALVVDQILAARIFSVTLTGGEPLLVIRSIAEQIRRLSRAGLSLSVNSTLAGLTPGLAELLISLGIRSALVSIPSHDPDIDKLITNSPVSFSQTASGVAVALQHGIRLKANMVVCRHNVDHVFATAQYVKTLGISEFAATKVSHPSMGETLHDAILTKSQFQFMAAQLQRAKQELHMSVDSVQAYAYCGLNDPCLRLDIPAFNKTCSAAKTFCVIAPNGLVRPCPVVSDSYGSVSDEAGLGGAWRAMKCWRDGSLLPELCQDCRHRATCAGGCRADAKQAVGSYCSPDPYCGHPQIPDIPRREYQWRVFPTLYRFNPSVKSRPEQFGGILYLRNSQWFAVDARLYEFAEQHRPAFTREDLATHLGVEVPQAEKTMTLLSEKKLIINVGGR